MLILDVYDKPFDYLLQVEKEYKKMYRQFYLVDDAEEDFE